MCPDRARTKTGASVPEGYYYRLFEPAEQPIAVQDEEKLVRLGEAMRYGIEWRRTLTPRVLWTMYSS
jgi:hypothetical protein